MRRAFRAGDLVILTIAFVLMIVLGVLSYIVAPPASAGLRASTYSSRSDGAKAAFLLLKELGYTVDRSFEPLVALRVDPASTVLVLASPSRPPAEQDQRAMQDFLGRGGIVLATGAGAGFLPGMRGVSPRVLNLPAFLLPKGEDGLAAPDAYRVATGAPAAPGLGMPSVLTALTRGAPEVHIASELYTPPKTRKTPAYVPVYRNGTTFGVMVTQVGQGLAIWWIGSTPLLNHDINTSGHLELLLNAIGPPGGRVVLWDEYYHGYDRGLLSYLGSTHLPMVFAQLAVMAVAAIFTFSRRRGPIRTLVVRPRASAMEFVDAMAALYQKARATTGAVETMRAHLRRVLIAATQMPAGSSDEELANATAARYQVQEQELREALAESASATGANAAALPADRALVIVQRLQSLAASIENRRSTEA